MNHPLAICQFDFNLKIVDLIPYQKSWNIKPINCVGVQTFKHSELKFTNVQMLKFHIRLCSNFDTTTLRACAVLFANL